MPKTRARIILSLEAKKCPAAQYLNSTHGNKTFCAKRNSRPAGNVSQQIRLLNLMKVKRTNKSTIVLKEVKRNDFLKLLCFLSLSLYIWMLRLFRSMKQLPKRKLWRARHYCSTSRKPLLLSQGYHMRLVFVQPKNCAIVEPRLETNRIEVSGSFFKF